MKFSVATVSSCDINCVAASRIYIYCSANKSIFGTQLTAISITI